MKPHNKLTLALIAVYSLFMLLWFLRDDTATKSASPQSAALTKPKFVSKTQPAAKDPFAAVEKSFRGGFPPAGRVVARESGQHIRREETGAFELQRYPGAQPFYDGEEVTAYVRVPSTKKQVARSRICENVTYWQGTESGCVL